VSIEVAPATTARWDDVVAVMGTRGDPSRCWCQYFRLRGKQWSGSSPDTNREALRGQVAEDAVPPGVVGYVDGEPAGWCATAPRTAYPRVLASPNWRTDADGAWAARASWCGPAGGVTAWPGICLPVRSTWPLHTAPPSSRAALST
jgi:hypothetical protein